MNDWLSGALGAALVVFALNGCSSDSSSAARSQAATDAGTGNDGGDLTVTLSDGPVQGDLVGGARRFLKIPYAKPPVGRPAVEGPRQERPLDRGSPRDRVRRRVPAEHELSRAPEHQ